MRLEWLMRAMLLTVFAFLVACGKTPDCEADVTLSTLDAKIRPLVETKFGERLRLPAVAPGTIELNPRKLAEAARTDPVKMIFEDMQQLANDSAGVRQCRAKVILALDLNDREQPLKKSALIGFSIYPNDPGFRLEVKAGDIAKLLE